MNCDLGFRFASPQALRCRPLRGLKATLDPITNDHEPRPEKRMAIFGVGHQFNRGLPESLSRARSHLLRLEIAVEIYHQPSRAGRVNLPLARYCGRSPGDEKSPRHPD